MTQKESLFQNLTTHKAPLFQNLMRHKNNYATNFNTRGLSHGGKKYTIDNTARNEFNFYSYGNRQHAQSNSYNNDMSIYGHSVIIRIRTRFILVEITITLLGVGITKTMVGVRTVAIQPGSLTRPV